MEVRVDAALGHLNLLLIWVGTRLVIVPCKSDRQFKQAQWIIMIDMLHSIQTAGAFNSVLTTSKHDHIVSPIVTWSGVLYMQCAELTTQR